MMQTRSWRLGPPLDDILLTEQIHRYRVLLIDIGSLVVFSHPPDVTEGATRAQRAGRGADRRCA